MIPNRTRKLPFLWFVFRYLNRKHLIKEVVYRYMQGFGRKGITGTKKSGVVFLKKVLKASKSKEKFYQSYGLVKFRPPGLTLF